VARGIGADPASGPMATPAGPWDPTTDWRPTGIEIPSDSNEIDKEAGRRARGGGLASGQVRDGATAPVGNPVGGESPRVGSGAGRPSIGRSAASFRAAGDPRQASRGQPRKIAAGIGSLGSWGLMGHSPWWFRPVPPQISAGRAPTASGAVDGPLRGERIDVAAPQGLEDRRGPMEAQVALDLELVTHLRDQVLDGGLSSLGGVRNPRAIGPIDPVEALALGVANQRLTVPGLTPKSRATCCCYRPRRTASTMARRRAISRSVCSWYIPHEEVCF
jgi:hypothetical protein